MQGVAVKANSLDYCPSVEYIFANLSRQSNTKIAILMFAKKTDQAIVEPLTNQEKEEDYEVHLHINTFTLENTPVEEKKLFK